MTAEKARLILAQIEIIISHKRAVKVLAEALDKDLFNCETVSQENHFHVYSEKDLRELAAALGKEVETKDDDSRIGFWHGDIWIFTLKDREEE